LGAAVGSSRCPDSELILSSFHFPDLRIQVATAGFLIVALALALFVQARNVYPQLLLGRLFFSIGGAAVSTMVTAVLPTMSYVAPESSNRHSNKAPRPVPSRALGGAAHVQTPSIASELTITPARFRSRSAQRANVTIGTEDSTGRYRATSRIAGFVGMFTGCGALLALALFLPLPARFQHDGILPGLALQYSYYIVASISTIIALWCFVGLRNLQSDAEKRWSIIFGKVQTETDESGRSATIPAWRLLFGAFKMGFQNSNIGLGYLGGFVARASSVGISLFVPLLVNALFLNSGLCSAISLADRPAGLPDIRRQCPRAYVVAAELTGVSQMVALLCAPAFGYLSARTSRKGLPLMIAAAAGIIGYPLFVSQFNPDDEDKVHRAIAFLAVSMIGVSQIGAIVCSLSTLSYGILAEDNTTDSVSATAADTARGDTDETTNLLRHERTAQAFEPVLSELKGSLAGVYSFYGGASILILTKLGGALFDNTSVGAPFYIMAAFNSILFCASAIIGLKKTSPIAANS